MPKRRLTILAFLAILLIDRLLKRAALLGVRHEFMRDVLTFDLFKNEGISFSLPFSGPLLWLVSVAILAGVCLMASRDFKARHYDRAGAYALFVFGACSNLFDRVMYGFTVDYLIFFSRSAVNVADGMILGGALWLLFSRGPANPGRSQGRS